MRSCRFAFALAALTSLGCAMLPAPPTSAPEVPAVLVGNPAPSFVATAVAAPHQVVSLAGHRGDVVLVNFFAVGCEPCKLEFPKLETLYEAYADNGFTIVAVSQDEPDDREGIGPFAQTYGAKFPVIWDDHHSIKELYEPGNLPSSYLVDRRGFVRYEHFGYREGEELALEREIHKLLAEPR